MSDNREIPTPSNVKPGDDFYQNADLSTGSTSGGQSLMFEPAAELIDLPSHGVLYKNISDDPDVTEKGAIRVRPMTVHEEKILTTPRLVRSGQALDMVFKNVIKSMGKNGQPLDPGELLSSDRVYIMLWLRAVSYGNIYKFNLTCPNNACGRKFEYEVDLGEHPITEMPVEDGKVPQEPFKFQLPFSKYTLIYRLPRGKDEMEIIKLQNQPKKMNDADETIVQRMSSAIQAILDPNGEEIPKQHIQPFVESMRAGDASAFRNELERVDSGIDDIKGIRCPHCDHEFDSPIPITENFFRTT